MTDKQAEIEQELRECSIAPALRGFSQEDLDKVLLAQQKLEGVGSTFSEPQEKVYNACIKREILLVPALMNESKKIMLEQNIPSFSKDKVESTQEKLKQIKKLITCAQTSDVKNAYELVKKGKKVDSRDLTPFLSLIRKLMNLGSSTAELDMASRVLSDVDNLHTSITASVPEPILDLSCNPFAHGTKNEARTAVREYKEVLEDVLKNGNGKKRKAAPNGGPRKHNKRDPSGPQPGAVPVDVPGTNGARPGSLTLIGQKGLPEITGADLEDPGESENEESEDADEEGEGEPPDGGPPQAAPPAGKGGGKPKDT